MNEKLEAFKMNKTQMNQIEGGKRYKCLISNSEFGGTFVYEYYEANSEEQAYNQCFFEYGANGSGYHISCTEASIYADPE